MSKSPEVHDGHSAALLAGCLGWAFVAFDSFLVVVTLTAIAKELHRTDKEIALSIALTLGFRPVGALIFGLLADRYGRRLPLMLDLAFYSVIEVLSGLAPDYKTFLVLRAPACFFVVYPRFGWRPMFFIGGLPALLALFVRFRVKESEVWQRTPHGSWRDLGRAIASNWRLLLYITVLMAGMNFASHGTQDMYPTFLEREWGFGPRSRA